MEVKNRAWNENQNKRCNHPQQSNAIRGLMIGKSGCGKTTLLINLLLRPGWLDYNNINIFGKSLFQSEYHIFKKAFEEKLSDHRELSSGKKNLMVFDDLLLEKQNTCESFYVANIFTSFTASWS